MEQVDTIEYWYGKLKQELTDKYVYKTTAVKCRDYYNKDEETENITYCMCSKTKRQILAKTMMEWYEGTH